MTSNVISWKEVIRRRSMNENEGKASLDKSINAEAETDFGTAVETEDHYLSAKEDYSDSGRESLMEYDSSNILQGAYPYTGTNQTIVCQLVPSQSAFQK
jgi:hypothetical protein